jgi:Methyltransferase domain
MDECCGAAGPNGYEAVFDARYAGKAARRYRRAGLTPTERLVVEFVTSAGVEGASVLEVGGGVGEVQLALLDRGAARTTNLELSAAYESDAQRLIAESGVGDRVERILGVDLATAPEAVGPADVVVLHRVVCCYPDYERLLGAAADRARRLVVFTHPPRTMWTRTAVRLSNVMVGLSGRSYRGFVHSPDGMGDVLRRHGFELAYRHPGWSWCVVGAQRG